MARVTCTLLIDIIALGKSTIEQDLQLSSSTRGIPKEYEKLGSPRAARTTGSRCSWKDTTDLLFKNGARSGYVNFCPYKSCYMLILMQTYCWPLFPYPTSRLHRQEIRRL